MAARPTHYAIPPAKVMGDSPRLNHPEMAVKVASSLEDMMRVMSVRTLVYMGDQECPYDEEFDGNDFAGLHVLATLDGEPIGTLRLRFFADFAKLERVALRKEFRQSASARKMIQFGLDICARKGYRVVYGHAQVRLLRFWRSFGFQKRMDRPHFHYSDHEYAEIVCELSAHPEALTMDADPMALVRPEGRWDQSGILDRSAVRPATNPNHS